jgi:hypothetical protein
MRAAAATIAGLALASALLAAACSNTPSSTTTPSATTSTPFTEVFIGTLPVGGSSFYSFTVSQTSNVFLMMASLTTATPAPTVSVPLNLGLGVPAGIGCDLSQSVTVTPALTPQIGVTLDPGIYCANIQDVGYLTSPVTFAIRIVHR